MTYVIPQDWSPIPAALDLDDLALLRAVGAVDHRPADRWRGAAERWRLVPPPSSVVLPRPLRVAAPQRHLFHCAGSGEGIANLTYGSVAQVPENTLAVQLALRNYADMPGVLNVAVAPSAAVHDCITPVRGDGTPDLGLFRQATFGGKTDLPLHRCARPGGMVPVPSIMLTDPLPLPHTCARVDGRPGRLLFFRQFSPHGPQPVDMFDVGSHADRLPEYGADPLLTTPTLGGGWQCLGNVAQPDYGTPPEGPGLGYNRSVVLGNALIAILAGRTGTIMIAGDSVVSGYGSHDGMQTIASELARMVMALRPGLHVSVWNEAQQGDNSGNYLPRVVNALLTVKPRLTLLQAFSRNDWQSDTEQQAYKQFQNVMITADAALAAGSEVMLITTSPFGSIGGQARYDPVRAYADSLIRATGLPLLDLGRLWGVPGASPSAFRPGLSVDAAHPTDRAITLAAAAALPFAQTVF